MLNRTQIRQEEEMKKKQKRRETLNRKIGMYHSIRIYASMCVLYAHPERKKKIQIF